MLGGLTAEEDSIIDRALAETYAAKDISPETDPKFWGQNTPLMSDLEDVLSTMEGAESLVRRLQKLRGANGRPGKLSVSVATFISKPHTPFQWCAQLSLAESASRIRLIKDRTNLPGIQFKWQNPEVSRLEGLWARGDRRLSRLLITAYRKGCRFDGWSDQFQYHLWEDSFEAEGIDPEELSLSGDRMKTRPRS